MHEDQIYIDAIVNNDKELIDKLYKDCFPMIRNLVWRYKGNDADATDVFHDALFDLVKKVKKQQFILPAPICAYIRGMCENKLKDESKKREREGVTSVDFDRLIEIIGEDVFKSFQKNQLDGARLALARKKFKELSKGCQELLLLSLEEVSPGKWRQGKDVAHILNKNEGATRKQKCECIVRLIQLVMNDPEFENLK